MIEKIENKLEERIDSYKNLNEFINKKEEFIDTVIYEFGCLCEEKFKDEEIMQFYNKYKKQIINDMIKLYQCNF